MTQPIATTGTLERNAALAQLAEERERRVREAEESCARLQAAHNVAYREANAAERAARQGRVALVDRRRERAMEGLDRSVQAAERRFIAAVEHHKRDLCRLGGEITLEPLATMWIAARSPEFLADVRDQLSDLPDTTERDARAALQKLKDTAAAARRAQETALAEYEEASRHLVAVRGYQDDARRGR